MSNERRAEIEQLEWAAIPPELSAGPARQPLSKRQLKNWSLVLQAKHIPWRTEKQDNRLQLLVPAGDFQAACREIRLYENENRNWPPPLPPERKPYENTASTIGVLILLALFHNLTTHWLHPFGHATGAWTALGNAHVGKIMAGEWWRLITALTLHSGPLHLTGNIVVGGIFIVRLCRLLGSGPAWLLVLLSGALGNLLNCLVQAPTHRSIGASTAVFGALGLLATINMLHYRRSLWRRWPTPVAAALGLLALLGTGGENTDIGAHLFGFLGGMMLGLFVTCANTTKRRMNPGLNRSLAVLAATLVSGAWWLAFTP